MKKQNTNKKKNNNPVVGLFKENHDSLLNILRYYLIDNISNLYPELGKDFLAKKVILAKPTVEEFGDYSTNIAFVISGQLKKNPREIAQKLVEKINEDLKVGSDKKSAGKKGLPGLTDRTLERAEMAGTGFVNLWFSQSVFSTRLALVLGQKDGDRLTRNINNLNPQNLNGRRIMIEFAHPNTHKEFHIGHLRNISIGESLVRIMEANGVEVFRANYEGDVGMHVAKAIWGVYEKIINYKLSSINELKITNEEKREKVLEEIRKLSPAEKAKFLGEAYALGSKMAEENKDVQREIIELNKKIYKDPKKADLWEETRRWSLEYFDTVYKRLGTHFDRLFFESEVEATGRQLVIDNVKTGIFIKDKDGSIYFPGEHYGLNNCVFVTKEDYATYEGKEIALEELEMDTFPYDLSINVVAYEQKNFFEIGYKATEVLFPRHKGKHYHLPYGMVNLKGAKLSSRTGQVVTADFLLDQAKAKIMEIMRKSQHAGEQVKSTSKNSKVEEPRLNMEKIAEAVAVGAVKYSMLRVNPLIDISFDLSESVAFEGDSGPYLLYTYARCRSVLRKAKIKDQRSKIGESELNLNTLKEYHNISEEEKSVVRTIYHFPEVVMEAGKTLSPNLICSYLFDLSQKFNLFYNKHSILGIRNQESGIRNEEITSFRLALTEVTANVINAGLYLLGIKTVERM